MTTNNNSLNNGNEKAEPLNTRSKHKAADLPTDEKVSKNLPSAFVKNDRKAEKRSETKKIILVSTATATVTTILIITVFAIFGSFFSHHHERNAPVKNEKRDSYLHEKTDESWNQDNWKNNKDNRFD